MVRRRLRIFGRVQGVGYRDGLRRQAATLGVTGWVRNRRDGTVEALLQGAPERVEQVLAWARRGPSAARADQVLVEVAGSEEPVHESFEQRPTA